MIEIAVFAYAVGKSGGDVVCTPQARPVRHADSLLALPELLPVPSELLPLPPDFLSLPPALLLWPFDFLPRLPALLPVPSASLPACPELLPRLSDLYTLAGIQRLLFGPQGRRGFRRPGTPALGFSPRTPHFA